MVFGTGLQAREHVAALLAVRPLRRITIVGRTAEAVSSFIAEVPHEGAVMYGLASNDEATVDRALASADIVCTCTSSAVPVLRGASLRRGAHVNSVGAYTADTREVDDTVLQRARRVLLDCAEAAKAGDIVLPQRAGVVKRTQELGDALRGTVWAPSRRAEGAVEEAGDITFFKVSAGALWLG